MFVNHVDRSGRIGVILEGMHTLAARGIPDANSTISTSCIELRVHELDSGHWACMSAGELLLEEKQRNGEEEKA
jgi:hypothetical protein